MIRHSSAGVLSTLVIAALMLSAAPAAAVVRPQVTGTARASVVISQTALPSIVVSIAGSTMPPQVLKVGRLAPVSVVVTDTSLDGLELAALYPHNRLVVWLSHGQRKFAQIHSQLRSQPTKAAARPRRWWIRLAPVQRAFRLNAGGRTRHNLPATQATASGPIGLSDRLSAEASAASQTVLLGSSEQIPSSDRAGPHASRAPPFITII